MQPMSIAFAKSAFLVEVEPDFRNPETPSFVAHLTMLEDDGTLLRPVVSDGGKRVVLEGTTEPRALTRALRFLRRHFGVRSGPWQTWHPHHMTWGKPVVVSEELTPAGLVTPS